MRSPTSRSVHAIKMEDFKFQEWERLTPEVSDGEAHARLWLQGREWLFRRCGPWWFGRDAEDVEGNFHFLFRPVLAVYSHDFWFANEHAQVSDVREFLKGATRAEMRAACFRVWVLPAVRLAWSEPDGWILGIDAATLGDHRPRWRFSVLTPAPVAHMPSSLLFSRLQSEWQNEKSDLRFAARFAALPELERALLGVRTRLDTPQGFAQLIKSALCAFGAPWPSSADTITLEFSSVGGGGRFVLEERHPFGVRESAILGHIVRAFEPRQLPDSPDLPLCVRSLTEGGWSRSFSIVVARPSMHDQLEGMLALRSWLETNWPAGVRHLEKVV